MEKVCEPGLKTYQRVIKRSFDLFVSIFCLVIFSWLICLSWVIASLSTGSNGFFIQKRIGLNGRLFKLIKIKTMIDTPTPTTTVTGRGDPRITRFGAFFRKTKIDELPQLFNILIGEMSFVGPRPDVPGFADALTGRDRLILSVRPGITGPATLKYRNEEDLLATQSNPEEYNRHVIWPDKVRLNLDYVRNWSFALDLRYIFKTLAG